MKHSILLTILVVLSLGLINSQTASAVQLLGEDFTYADGNFDGTQNGGFSLNAGNQWTSAWTFSGQTSGGIDAWRVDTGRANAPGNNLASNAARQNGDIMRSFSTSQPAGTTMYFSFDMERRNDQEGTYETTVQFLGGQVEVGLRNDNLTARVGGDTDTSGNPAAAFSSTFIARLEFEAAGTDEILTVWQDPASEADVPLLVAQADLGQLDLGNLLVLNKLNQDNNEFFIDNFRLGTDFNFSAQVPEPATIAIWSMLGLAAVGIGWRRCRRKS